MIRHKLSPERMAATVALALATITATAAVAWDGSVPGWEVDVLRFFNGWPDWLQPVMWVVQQVGVLLSPIIAGLVVV